MSTDQGETRIEIARYSLDGLDVALMWEPAAEHPKAVVSVADGSTATRFEIRTEAYLALDVYYHPLAYRDFGTVRPDPAPRESRLAAAPGWGPGIRRGRPARADVRVEA
jgi:hypothetical protein